MEKRESKCRLLFQTRFLIGNRREKKKGEQENGIICNKHSHSIRAYGWAAEGPLYNLEGLH